MSVSSSSSAIIVPGLEFTIAELYAMCSQGVLVSVIGEAFRPISVPESMDLRAAALVHHVPPGLAGRAALGRLSAAWVYGCSPPPALISLLINSAHRSTALPPSSGCVLHEVRLGPFDVEQRGGALLTSAIRTAVDVATHETPEVSIGVLNALSIRAELNCPLGRIRQALVDAVHIPGKRAALELLGGMIGKT